MPATAHRSRALRATAAADTTRRGDVRGRGRRRDRGQTLVEFALIFPFFWVILASIFYFGFMLYARMTVINAAREGARAGAMALDATTIPGVIQGRVISAASAAGVPLTASNVTIACLQTTSSITSPPACTWTLYDKTTNPGGAHRGDSVNVTVSYLFPNPIPLCIKLLGNTIICLPTTFSLSSTVQMVLDGVPPE